MKIRDLKQLYQNHAGKVTDKWSSYLEVYDELFEEFRDQDINLLEIGVQNGGSLEIWAKFFKHAKSIVGCDINPRCGELKFEDNRIEVLVGDITSEIIESKTKKIAKGFNIIIDDGSHTSFDIIKTFSRYFSHLENGGLYIIEDLHCSYWEGFGGGLFYPYSAMSFLKRLSDIINSEHWGNGTDRKKMLEGFEQEYDVKFQEDDLATVYSIQISNSLCVIQKQGSKDNALGARFISGKTATVIPGLKNDSEFKTDESNNSWTNIEVIPDENWFKLKEEISGKNDEINRLRIAHEKNMSKTVRELHELSEAKSKSEAQVIEHTETINLLEKRIHELELHSASLDYINRQHISTIEEILSSKSWRLSKPIRIVTYIVRQTSTYPNRMIALFRREGFHRGMIRVWEKLSEPGCRGLKEKAKSRWFYGSIDHTSPITTRFTKLNSGIQSESSSKSEPEIPTIDFDTTNEGFTDYQSNTPLSTDLKVIPFYLPQFHPIPENDAWWGKGFTEWTNVGKAIPNYKGHYQPHCPIHLGYYDLRVPEVMQEQVRLAKNYGIYGFNYYFYWFGGEILLDTPLNMMLKDKKIDMPFCLTWANENWTRRWDGAEQDILMAQNHSDEDSLNFIRHLMKFFNDERYIKVNSKPLLIIYRADIIPNIEHTADIWRSEVKKHGFPGLYLVSAQTFGITSPEKFGFDASMEFPPHTAKSRSVLSSLEITNNDFKGEVFSYQEVVSNAVKKAEPKYKLFRTAMLSWDNTARKQSNGHIFQGFSLTSYKQWLSSIVSRFHNNEKYNTDEKLVFINAWNEWAEGTHLEPDRKYGYGYLQATYDVLKDYDDKYSGYLTSFSQLSAQYEIGIILHLHYSDIWDQLSKILLNLFDVLPFDLYITVTSSELAEKIKTECPHAQIVLVENRGRDILPFINTLKRVCDLGHKTVCKIHSKKSIYRADGDALRDSLLESLLGTADRVKTIVDLYEENPALGLLVPESALIPHTDKNMYFDREYVKNLSNKLDTDFKSDFFPAGSMFWFRPSSLTALTKLSEDDFDIEQGLADGTTSHAIERLFCIVAKANGHTVETC